MKKLVILILCVGVFATMDEQVAERLQYLRKTLTEKAESIVVLKQRAPNYLHPKRPADFPTINCDGDTIIWDWKYQVAYNEKRLFAHYSEAGCVKLIILKK